MTTATYDKGGAITLPAPALLRSATTMFPR
jgi:hypothetical protein